MNYTNKSKKIYRRSRNKKYKSSKAKWRQMMRKLIEK